MASKRQLAAIMFTDITGYSAMMGADEEYARLIRNRHRKVFRESHENHGGKILQYYGDGTLSIFESAAAAVECAVDMQIEYRREPEVPLRIGIHTGDISYDDEGAYGDGLNIAARIERLCVPGGIYISAKVFDDIKNHKWLTAISLGLFKLRNIHREIEIFSITCKGLAVPSVEEIRSHPEYMQETRVARSQVAVEPEVEYEPEVVIRGRKSKGVAALLAFFFGIFGIHRLYLGQRKKGMAHLVLSIFALVLTANGVENPIPPIVIFAIIGFIDFILLLAMSRTDFNLKYNTVKAEQAPVRKKKAAPQPAPSTQRSTSRHRPRQMPMEGVTKVEANPSMIRGVEYYKQENYHEAMREFHKALERDPNSPAAFFNLACCSSILDDHDSAFQYLSKAISVGFDDFDRIAKHEALSELREHPDYEAFVENGYRVVSKLPPPKEDVLEALQKFNPEVLDRLEELGDLLDKGELTREEFEVQKRQILGH